MRATPPRLRACANYHTHLPEIKRPPRQQLLGHQVGDADDETTLQRGAPDVASMYMRVTFRRGVLVRRQQRRRLSSPAICEHARLGLPNYRLLRKHPLVLVPYLLPASSVLEVEQWYKALITLLRFTRHVPPLRTCCGNRSVSGGTRYGWTPRQMKPRRPRRPRPRAFGPWPPVARPVHTSRVRQTPDS